MTQTRRLALFGVAGLMTMFVFGGRAGLAAVQQQAKEGAPAAETKAAEAKPAPEAAVPKEESSVTEHTIRIGGQTIPYKATASTILLKNDKGEPIASIFSIAYVRTDVKDSAKRPVAFLYNGGPGSASLWLHMGAFGPRRVLTKNAAPTGPAPYQVVDNANCLLDKADLVFIDPVGTGFSRAVGKGQNKDFWGVDQDMKSLAQFLGIWVNRNNRWNSPKFLIGESYGTFRSVALANYLQSHDGMYINGIVLISSVLNINTLEFYTADDMPYIFYVPSYAASAWYYKTLKNRPDDLNAFLKEARAFAATEYAAALMKGASLGDAEKAEVAKKLSAFTGLSEEYLINANLRVRLSQFEAELERSRKLTVGRYDARYSGPTYDLLTEHAEYDPSYIAVNGAFTAAINEYLREELKFSSELTYETLSYEVNRHWDWKHNAGPDGGPGVPSVNDDLVNAFRSNPSLQVEIENGFFDLATPFFATEYTMDHLGLPATMRSRIHLDYYDSGHMIYLNEEELPKLKNNVANFIGGAAKP
ncbi:MAG TPA: peptidase S10 [Candidatus Polarisedimenticolia bacterium]|nr:peptidase S10 [Candidatus Polarisedimenticolia bacterium]